MTNDSKQQIFKQVIKLSSLKTSNFPYKEQFWGFICKNFDLPEEFIRQYKDIIDWGKVCRYQTLSMNFVRQFKHKIDWEWYRHVLNKKEKREFFRKEL